MAEAKKRKRIKLSEGDVFELRVPDGRLGYGIVIKRGRLKNGGAPYVALFASAYSTRPSLVELADDKIALVGWTTDALVYHGRWNVVAHDAPIPSVPLPNFKVEMGGKFYVTDVHGDLIREATAAERNQLNYRSSFAPIILQDAFEATHGFGQWREDYDELLPG